ncbi:ribosome biogenesis GTPase Der [Enterobacterales bacterium endosymbiont of Anomoneura mori]|uniref:ribosome biogenesis GTPase Der n=1 Tax=Enterobacterales bacterium endosymbiont of Anomoneura mori TaxID=3132096 RepID=UPI00399CBBC6
MIPIITIIGKSNVGKSTLFNYLLCKKKSLVNNSLNLTRDRNYGYIKIKNKNFIIVDTGGVNNFKDDIQIKIAAQIFISIKKSNIIFFLVDAYENLTPEDEIFNKYIYEFKDKIFLIINKIDKVNYKIKNLNFYKLGINNKIFPISSYNGYGINILFENIILFLKKNNKKIKIKKIKKIKKKKEIKIKLIIIGKPNVGKSTLINNILNEERIIVHNLPGTTNDCIYIPTIYNKIKYIIIDTPGIINIKNNNKNILYISKILKLIKKSDIVLFLIDIVKDITNKDLLIINFIIKNGYSLVIAFNKLDKINKYKIIEKKNIIKNSFKFIKNTYIKYISGLKGIGIKNLLDSIENTYKSSKKQIKTSKINKVMKNAIIKHQPPIFKGYPIKFKYAHLGNYNPLTIIIHGNKVINITKLYKKYLINYFSKKLNIIGTKILLKFKENKNPYKN